MNQEQGPVEQPTGSRRTNGQNSIGTDIPHFVTRYGNPSQDPFPPNRPVLDMLRQKIGIAS
jgi:hypothetical protein